MNKIKSFFSRLRRKQSDSKPVKIIINHSSDAVGLQPVCYTIPENFNQFILKLDSDIDELISKSKPDRYNKQFYEPIVNREVELALKELAVQRETHKKDIHDIRIYQQSRFGAIEKHLQKMETALSKNEEEQK